MIRQPLNQLESDCYKITRPELDQVLKAELQRLSEQTYLRSSAILAENFVRVLGSLQTCKNPDNLPYQVPLLGIDTQGSQGGRGARI